MYVSKFLIKNFADVAKGVSWYGDNQTFYHGPNGVLFHHPLTEGMWRGQFLDEVGQRVDRLSEAEKSTLGMTPNEWKEYEDAASLVRTSRRPLA